MLAAVQKFPHERSAPPVAADDPWGGLMAAAQLGNAGAYTRLMTEVDGWLRRYYARRLPLSMVEDAAQDTLLTLHIRRHTYEPGRPFKAWLAGIARYKWIDRLRALDRDPAVSRADEISEDIAIDDHGPAIVGALLLRELLSQLKPAQSEVIKLVKLEGLSIEEAAKRTGQSASLVKVNMHRGLARLSHIAAADVT
jgi:RNA polymerase sigma-70 factor (ECF subfamily)